MRSCADCNNFIAKVTLKKKCCMLTARFVWGQSTAYCRQGLLMDENNQVKVFKNIFTKDGIADKKLYRFAEQCNMYDNEK